MSPAQFKLPLLSQQPILQNGSKTNSYLLRDDFICVMVPLNILERESKGGHWDRNSLLPEIAKNRIVLEQFQVTYQNCISNIYIQMKTSVNLYRFFFAAYIFAMEFHRLSEAAPKPFC